MNSFYLLTHEGFQNSSLRERVGWLIYLLSEGECIDASQLLTSFAPALTTNPKINIHSGDQTLKDGRRFLAKYHILELPNQSSLLGSQDTLIAVTGDYQSIVKTLGLIRPFQCLMCVELNTSWPLQQSLELHDNFANLKFYLPIKEFAEDPFFDSTEIESLLTTNPWLKERVADFLVFDPNWASNKDRCRQRSMVHSLRALAPSPKPLPTISDRLLDSFKSRFLDCVTSHTRKPLAKLIAYSAYFKASLKNNRWSKTAYKLCSAFKKKWLQTIWWPLEFHWRVQVNGIARSDYLIDKNRRIQNRIANRRSSNQQRRLAKQEKVIAACLQRQLQIENEIQKRHTDRKRRTGFV